MSDNSTFTPDSKTIEYIFTLLQEQGVVYDGSDWFTRFNNIRLEEVEEERDGEKQKVFKLKAHNHRTARLGGQHFHTTLAERTVLSNGMKYRAEYAFEHDQGRDKVGDSVIELRLRKGRWMVRIEKDEVLLNEEASLILIRAPRSSIDNPVTQAVRRRVFNMANGGYANTARLGGNVIKQHVVYPKWDESLDEDDFMDVFDYADEKDMIGQSTLLKALKYLPATVARQVFEQMRDPDVVA